MFAPKIGKRKNVFSKWVDNAPKGGYNRVTIAQMGTSSERRRPMRARLQQLREAYGFTQQTFSEAVGTSRSHYSQIETGEKYPSLRLAMRIKQVLAYTDDDLFENTTVPIPLKKGK